MLYIFRRKLGDLEKNTNFLGYLGFFRRRGNHVTHSLYHSPLLDIDTQVFDFTTKTVFLYLNLLHKILLLMISLG